MDKYESNFRTTQMDVQLADKAKIVANTTAHWQPQKLVQGSNTQYSLTGLA